MKMIYQSEAFHHIYAIDVEYLGNISRLTDANAMLKSMPSGVDFYSLHKHKIDIATFVNGDFYNDIENAVEFELNTADIPELYAGDVIYETSESLRINTMWAYKLKLTWLDKIQPMQFADLIFYRIRLDIRLIWYTNYYIWRGSAIMNKELLLPVYQPKNKII